MSWVNRQYITYVLSFQLHLHLSFVIIWTHISGDYNGSSCGSTRTSTSFRVDAFLSESRCPCVCSHFFHPFSKSCLLQRKEQFEHPMCLVFLLAVPSTYVLANTVGPIVELKVAHLSICLSGTMKPAIQALSLCLFLSNSHSLFTFAFLHCDSRQSNITPDPQETDCQASLFKVEVKQPCT